MVNLVPDAKTPTCEGCKHLQGYMNHIEYTFEYRCHLNATPTKKDPRKGSKLLCYGYSIDNYNQWHKDIEDNEALLIPRSSENLLEVFRLNYIPKNPMPRCKEFVSIA